MNIFKKAACVTIVLCMILSFAGCHKKNEIAVTVDGYKYTSGYYMCAMVNAYMEAQQEVYNNLSEKEQQSTSIDFFKKKIDKKPFTTWVEDRTIELLKENTIYKSLCDKAGVKMDDETKENTEYYASMYWSNYGYAQMFEPNGVSEETYKKYLVDSSYSTLYFEHLYGEKGEKQIPKADIEKELYDKFIIADLLEVTFSEETDEQKADIKAKFTKYADDIKKSKTTFGEVYDEYYNIKDENKNTTETDENKPKDIYASVIGKEGTGYEHDYFDKINALTVGKVELFEKENNAGFLIAIKQDIKDDAYYLEEMDMTVRHLLKDEEFSKDMKDQSKKLKVETNKYAVKQFKVKNIVEPSYS